MHGRVLLVVLFYFQTYGDRYLCCAHKAVGDLPVPVRTCNKNGVRRPYAWLAPGVDKGFVVEGSEIATVEGPGRPRHLSSTRDATQRSQSRFIFTYEPLTLGRLSEANPK